MKYFDTLPIFDKTFRNIFEKVRVAFVRDDELIKYQMDEFETLANVSQKWYNTGDYWWVIALLNDIFDINFDVPFPATQAERIARDIAKTETFSDCVVESYITILSSGQQEQVITFENPDQKPYTVLTNIRSLLAHYNIVHEKINHNQFKLILSEIPTQATQIAYTIIQSPVKTTSTDLSFFSTIYDLILTEINFKRELYILSPQHLNKFVAQFQLVLSQRRKLQSPGYFENEQYLSEVNLLKEYADIEDIQYGVLADMQLNLQTTGIEYYKQLLVEHFDLEHKIIVNPTSHNIGTYAINQKISNPRVINSGEHDQLFDFVSIAMDRIDYTTEQKIIDAGEIRLTNNITNIVVDNQTSQAVTDKDHLLLYTTPVYRNSSDLDNVSAISFYPINTNTIRVIKTGDEPLYINYAVILGTLKPDPTFVVTFEDWDGSIIATYTVFEGDSITPPADPIREGYIFDGWIGDYTNITADITITADYSIKTYTIAIDESSNGILSETGTFVMTYDDVKEFIADANEHGLISDITLDGVSLSLDTEFDLMLHPHVNNLYVAYQADTYTVTFEDYDGSVIDTQTVEHGSDATLPADPTREIHTFTGWLGNHTNITANTTIIAQYDIDTYTVTFVDYDSSVIEIQTVEHGSDATLPADPTRTGYTFDDWDTSHLNIVANTTITATYIINSYTVTFEDWDGSIIDTQSVEYNHHAILPPDPIRDGYNFDTWDTSHLNITADTTITALYDTETFTVTFYDYDSNVIATDTVNYGTAATPPADPTYPNYTFTGWDVDFSNVVSDLDVYAQFDLNTYIVTFEDWNGSALNIQTVEHGSDAVLPTDPARFGYTFDGWIGSHLNIVDDTTITATYTINSYTVNFYDWDGTLLDTQIVEYGSDATLPPNPTRDGYVFTGWDVSHENISFDAHITALYRMITISGSLTAGDTSIELADGIELYNGIMFINGTKYDLTNPAHATLDNTGTNTIIEFDAVGSDGEYIILRAEDESQFDTISGSIAAGDTSIELTDGVELTHGLMFIGGSTYDLSNASHATINNSGTNTIIEFDAVGSDSEYIILRIFENTQMNTISGSLTAGDTSIELTDDVLLNGGLMFIGGKIYDLSNASHATLDNTGTNTIIEFDAVGSDSEYIILRFT